MRKLEFNTHKNKIILAVSILLIVITLLTGYYGSGDIGDYANVAKFFAGDSNSDIRNSHSYLYGFVHAPLVDLFDSFIVFKITSLIFLFLIILSVYKISGRNLRSLWMILLSPVVWYMAPWINPIQLSSLLFLWAFFFINKFEQSHKIKHLFFSGILIGFAWAFWDTMLFFGAILAIVFLWNKKSYYSLLFGVFVLLGLLPRLILDQILFNFAFFTIFKSFFGTFSNVFGGIYAAGYRHASFTLTTLILLLVSIPFGFWTLYNPKKFTRRRKSMIFLSLSLLFLLVNFQIRYILVLAPIIILLLGRSLTDRAFKIHMILSVIVVVLFIFPYTLQINSGLNNEAYGTDFTGILQNGITINSQSLQDSVSQDLDEITTDFPDQIFIVGDNPDNYRFLAYVYWGNSVEEFVSIQDYNLWLSNSSELFSRTFQPTPKINNRRQIWISGGLNKNAADPTNFEEINYAITLEDQLSLSGFTKIKKYQTLTLWGKAGN